MRSYLDFFMERHESQSKSIAMLLSDATFSELFVQYNTVTLSSATVKRQFFLGNDVLKQNNLDSEINGGYIG